jgi:hypothetical protein
MRLTSLVLMISWAVLLPGLAFAQYGYVRECKETVANQLNVSTLDISAELGPYSQNGNRIVNWRSRRANESNGYCEFNTATGELVRAEAGEYAGPLENRPGFGSAPGQRDMGYGQTPGMGYGQAFVNAPRVKVDNSGRGDFKGPRKSFHIRHSWLDTRGEQTIITLSDGDDFKISFYGPIVQQNGDREFTMDIDNSNLGGASGTATFRLSQDHKKVEYISMNGLLQGRDFNGNFRR